MAASGLEEVDTYVLCQHNTITQYVTTCPILEMCLVGERLPGTRVAWWWWDKEGINLEGVRSAERAT